MSRNPAARMGRWSAAHWKTATFGWLAFVVAAVVVGGAVGTKQLGDTAAPGESGRMAAILDDAFERPAEESVLVESETRTVDDPAFAEAIDDVVARLRATGAVTALRSPLARGNEGQVSVDRRAAVVRFDVRGDPDTAYERIGPVVQAVERAQATHPELFVASFGETTADEEISEAVAKDLERAGLLSLPVTLVVLVLAFGALVAAGIPLLLALSAVIAALGLLAIPSQVWPVDENVSAVVLLIGLAVGVDYSLFYLKREREERAAGRSERAALETAAATSGRAVLVSGLTVAIAMAGMFLAGDPTFGSFAMATILVVAIAVLGSLTVLPALLGRLGDNANRLRIPLVHRLQRPGGGRLWGWILDRVLRRPFVSAVASAAILVALAVPALGMNTVDPGIEALPRDFRAVEAYARLQDAFPGEQAPAVAVVKARSVDDPRVAAAIDELERRAVESGAAHAPVTVEVSPDRTVARIELPLAGTGSDDASLEALETLRDDVVPATVGALAGVTAGVTGETAMGQDFDAALHRSAPLVFAFVLTFAFLLLLVSFRSVVIAAKAVVLNLLSVAAAYGVLVLVFQHGWGQSLLGFDYTGGVVVWLPVFLFVILFGLSMDYHVFILSRIREAHDRGMRTGDAIAHGIRSTAGVVTSAAIVMVFVFSLFGTLSLVMMKQFGVGLAAAVLIDATIVRAVLLPATMKLLGEWNWYLPAWLSWLPRVELDGAAMPAAAVSVPAPVPRRRRQRRLRALLARAFDARPAVVPRARLAAAATHTSVSLDPVRLPFASTWQGSHATAMATTVDRSRLRRMLSGSATVVGGLAVLLTVVWALSTPGEYFWPAQVILPFALALVVGWWVVQVDERPEIRARFADSRPLALHAGASGALWLYIATQWVLSGGGYFWPGWVLLALGVLFAIHASVVLVQREHRRSDRIEALETTRAGAVDGQETELRRIERDLHDGAQARLVALGMSLGMAEETLAADPEAARRHLDDARAAAREALVELRDLARGIHPPILTDRGLEAAVRALATRTPLRVDVAVELAERPRPAVETAAYFVVAEALANAAKHAGATAVAIDVRVEDGALVAEIRDDGRGGANADGNGLTGLRRRVEALDGSLGVASPVGGPTTVRAELPCAS